MQPISEMTTDLSNPPVVPGLSPRCGSCVHFARKANFTVEGQPTVCSSPRIGRLPNSKPCDKYRPDSLKFLELAQGTKDAALGMVAALAKDAKFKNKMAEGTYTLVAWLGVLSYSIKKGIPLGSKVLCAAQGNAPDDHGPGTLVYLDHKDAVMLRDSDGVRVWFEAKYLRSAEGKKVKEDSEVGDDDSGIDPKRIKSAGGKRTKAPASKKEVKEKDKKKPAKKPAKKKAEKKKAEKKPAKKPTKKAAKKPAKKPAAKKKK